MIGYSSTGVEFVGMEPRGTYRVAAFDDGACHMFDLATNVKVETSLAAAMLGARLLREHRKRKEQFERNYVKGRRLFVGPGSTY